MVPEKWDPSDEPTESFEKAIARSRVDKLPLLFEHYGIEDHSDYFRLSLVLAIDHVPGFAVKEIPYKLRHGDYGAVEPVTKTGRHREWTGERLSDLLEAVDAIKRKKKLTSDRDALRELSRCEPWRSPPGHRGDTKQWIETLETRLQEAKSYESRAQKRLDNALKMFNK